MHPGPALRLAVTRCHPSPKSITIVYVLILFLSLGPGWLHTAHTKNVLRLQVVCTVPVCHWHVQVSTIVYSILVLNLELLVVAASSCRARDDLLVRRSTSSNYFVVTQPPSPPSRRVVVKLGVLELPPESSYIDELSKPPWLPWQLLFTMHTQADTVTEFKSNHYY